jgi:hypothetical protein
MFVTFDVPPFIHHIGEQLGHSWTKERRHHLVITPRLAPAIQKLRIVVTDFQFPDTISLLHIENRNTRRLRDSNPRRCYPNLISSEAP